MNQFSLGSQLGNYFLGIGLFLRASFELVFVVGAQTVGGELPTLLAVNEVFIEELFRGRLIVRNL